MQFFRFFLLFFLCCFVVWTLFVFGAFGRSSSMSQWVYDVYSQKQKLAQNIEGKKIVIVAGSNALFGIKSSMLSQAFNIPVLNYGVNAGVELPLTLYEAKKVINRGDIVLMPLEYNMYTYNGNAGMQMIDYIVAREPQLFWKLTLYEQLYIIWHISFFRVLNAYIHPSHTHVTRGVYGAHHIDSYGDQTHTTKKEQTEAMRHAVQMSHKNPPSYGKEFSQNALAWHYLKEFIQWCNKKDVRVIFMPSTLMFEKSFKSKKEERWFYEHLPEIIEKKGWKFVGKPFEYMYAPSAYFNTNFHLVKQAREQRTRQMITELQSSHLLETMPHRNH